MRGSLPARPAERFLENRRRVSQSLPCIKKHSVGVDDAVRPKPAITAAPVGRMASAAVSGVRSATDALCPLRVHIRPAKQLAYLMGRCGHRPLQAFSGTTEKAGKRCAWDARCLPPQHDGKYQNRALRPPHESRLSTSNYARLYGDSAPDDSRCRRTAQVNQLPRKNITHLRIRRRISGRNAGAF